MQAPDAELRDGYPRAARMTAPRTYTVAGEVEIAGGWGLVLAPTNSSFYDPKTPICSGTHSWRERPGCSIIPAAGRCGRFLR